LASLILSGEEQRVRLFWKEQGLDCKQVNMRVLVVVCAISVCIGLSSAMWEVQQGVYYDPIGGTTSDKIHTLQPNGQITTSNDPVNIVEVASKMGLFIPQEILSNPSASTGNMPQQLALHANERQALQEFHERQLVGPSVIITGAKSTFNITYDSSLPTPDVAKPAIEAAIKVWADNFPSTVTMRVLSRWDSLDSGTLGSASSPYSVHGSICGTSKLLDNALYSSPSAAALEGVDFLSANQEHIRMQFNKNAAWSYDPTSNKTITFNTWDLMSVVLHEVCHGLFFNGRFSADAIYYNGGFLPGRFDRFLVPSSTASIVDKCYSKTDLAAIMLNSKRFVDPTKAGTNFLVFSPNPYQPGSSTYHFDTNQLSADCANLGIPVSECSALMTPSLTNGVLKRSPGMTTLRVMDAILGTSVGYGGKCDANPFDYFNL
jgi:hypothetical protein